MEARLIRAAVLAAVLLVSMGARYQSPISSSKRPTRTWPPQIAQAAETVSATTWPSNGSGRRCPTGRSRAR